MIIIVQESKARMPVTKQPVGDECAPNFKVKLKEVGIEKEKTETVWKTNSRLNRLLPGITDSLDLLANKNNTLIELADYESVQLIHFFCLIN